MFSSLPLLEAPQHIMMRVARIPHLSTQAKAVSLKWQEIGQAEQSWWYDIESRTGSDGLSMQQRHAPWLPAPASGAC